MDDSSLPTQFIIPTHLSDGLVYVVDYPVDYDFAYLILKSNFSDLESMSEFAMALLNPLVNTRTLSWVLQVILLFGGRSVDSS
jgi:hypothetical protein